MESLDYSNSIPSIVSKLLKLLGTRVTFTTVKKTLKGHPDFPTLLSISESLREWGIKTEAVQGAIDDLSNSDFPGIAHLKNNKFVVLKGMQDDKVCILDERLRSKKLSIESFAQNWSGVFLRVISRQGTGEKFYASNRKKELLLLFKNIFILIGLLSILVLTFLFGRGEIENVATVNSLVILKFGGFIFCLIMTLSSLKVGNSLINLCPEGRNFNCRKVVDSPYGKMLGIYISEMGLLYFAGGILSLIFSPYLKQTDTNLYFLSLINVAILPYAVFLLFNQAVIIRHWCWMCLLVHLFLWLEFCYLYMYILKGIRNMVTILPLSVFLGFSIPILFWISLRSLIVRLNLSESQEVELLRIKRNPDYIHFQLNKGMRINKSNFPLEIEIGPEDAQIYLLLVLNPLCIPCMDSYRQLKKIIVLGSGNIKAIIRFLVREETAEKKIEKSLDYKISLQIISAVLSRNRDELETVLDEWFFEKSRWKRSWSGQVLSAKSSEILKKHTAWAKCFNINSTPTIIFDDVILPSGIQVEDLRYYLLRRLEG